MTIFSIETYMAYDELLVMKRVAFYMAELTDAERPKCTTVLFIKKFEAVLTSFQQQHEIMVCDVPRDMPYQATLIDQNLRVSWCFELNTDNLLAHLIGQTGGDIKRIAPPNRK
jgi:hypothetical protein